jgi:serine/threonine-protein kinase RsbW
MGNPIITENSISIPSSQEYLVDVDSFVEKKLSMFGVEQSTIADIAISVTEVVINGIVHGNKSAPEKQVTVKIRKEDSTVEIVVTDQGDGFDPDLIESPIDEKNLMKEVGRGVFITKSLMDSVEIDSKPGRGTRVTLRKHI